MNLETTRRLLFVTAERYPTYRVDVSALFGRHLPRIGIFSDIVATLAPGVDRPPDWGAGEVWTCGGGGGSWRREARSFVHAVRQIIRARTGRYAALQVRDMPVTALCALLVSRVRRMPFFYWMSFPMPEAQITLARERGLAKGLAGFVQPWLRGRVWRVVLYRWVLPLADHVFVQSDRMKLDLIERGVPAARMTPVPMGVDCESMRLDAIRVSTDERLRGRRVLVYLGTLDRPRRVEVLFDMLALVRRAIPEAMLVLVGDALDVTQQPRLREYAATAGVIDHVLWTGWLPMPQAWSYVRAAEVALSPIPRGQLLDCGSPTKVPEYLVLGVPVVCNDNPDQQRVVLESGCGICCPYTAEDFSKASIELMRLDAQTRRRMIEAGRRYAVDHRDYRVLSARVAQAYESLFDNEVPGKGTFDPSEGVS